MFKTYLFISLLLTQRIINDDYKTLYYKGFDKMQKNELDEAKVLFEQSYHLSANSKTAFYLAFVYFEQKNWALAEAYANLALNNKPSLKNPTMHYLMTAEAIREISKSNMRLAGYESIIDYYYTDKSDIDRSVDHQEHMIQEMKKLQSLPDYEKKFIVEAVLYYDLPVPYDYKKGVTITNYNDFNLPEAYKKEMFLAKLLMIDLPLGDTSIEKSPKFKYHESDVILPLIAGQVDHL